MRRVNWGRACWTAFHALACLLSDTPENTTWLLFSFRAVTSVLPCPECRAHAATLVSLQSRPILTMDELRHAFFQFHNIVSGRKGVAPFPWAMYLDTHASGNPYAKLDSFLLSMRKAGRGGRDFTGGMAREKVCRTFVIGAKRRLASQTD